MHLRADRKRDCFFARRQSGLEPGAVVGLAAAAGFRGRFGWLSSAFDDVHALSKLFSGGENIRAVLKKYDDKEIVRMAETTFAYKMYAYYVVRCVVDMKNGIKQALVDDEFMQAVSSKPPLGKRQEMERIKMYALTTQFWGKSEQRWETPCSSQWLLR